jgi:hypothetical protein
MADADDGILHGSPYGSNDDFPTLVDLTPNREQGLQGKARQSPITFTTGP